LGEIPYSSATSGAAARDEIVRMLRRIGCDRIGFMDEYAEGCVLLAFEHRGRPVQMRASARGWAAWFLRENPWTSLPPNAGALSTLNISLGKGE
jgi:hypothetical protein